MFELTTGVTGEKLSAPAFRLFSHPDGTPPAFELNLSLRSPNGTVEQADFPLPSQIGELFLVETNCKEAESLVVASTTEIDEPSMAQGAPSFWRIDDRNFGVLLPMAERSLRLHATVNEAAAALPAGTNWVQVYFDGEVTWNELGDVGGTIQTISSEVIEGKGLRGYPLWHLQADGSIIAASIEHPYGVPAIATETHYSIPRRVNGLYQFSLARISGGKIVKVTCQGQEFSLAAGETPADGEYTIGRDILTVAGNLREQLEIVAVNIWPWPANLFYFRFLLEADLVIEQCRFLGRVFTDADNPLQPLANEFVQQGKNLYLFVDELPSRNLDFAPRIESTAGQVLSEVSW